MRPTCDACGDELSPGRTLYCLLKRDRLLHQYTSVSGVEREAAVAWLCPHHPQRLRHTGEPVSDSPTGVSRSLRAVGVVLLAAGVVWGALTAHEWYYSRGAIVVDGSSEPRTPKAPEPEELARARKRIAALERERERWLHSAQRAALPPAPRRVEPETSGLDIRSLFTVPPAPAPPAAPRTAHPRPASGKAAPPPLPQLPTAPRDAAVASRAASPAGAIRGPELTGGVPNRETTIPGSPREAALAPPASTQAPLGANILLPTVRRSDGSFR